MLIKQFFEHYGREKFQEFYPRGTDVFSLSDTLYDLFLVPAVYFYYKEDVKVDFFTYLPTFLNKRCKYTNSYKLLSGHLELLRNKLSWWNNLGITNFKGLGDLHECVYKIKSQNKVLYENVLGLERFLQDLETILPWVKEFLPCFEIKNKYVLRDYKEAQDSDVLHEDYYRNFGKVLAFCLYFRIVDIHMENVLATKNTPLLFDIEFIMTPDVSYFPFDIKITGLLSGQTTDNSTALLGGLYDVKSYLKPVLVDGDLYRPRIMWIVKSRRKWDNLPKDPKHPYEYINFIVDGYQQTVNNLIANQTSINSIVKTSNFKSRILARTTRLYKYLLLNYTFPQMKLKEPYLFFNKRLLETHTSGFFKPDKKVLAKLEASQLARFAIPYFMVEVHDKIVTDGNGNRVGILAETPYETWLFHTKLFPSFAVKQKNQIVKILRNNYARFLSLKGRQ